MARGIFLVQNRISRTTNKARASIHTTERTRGTLFSRFVLHEKVAVAIVSLVAGTSLRDDVLRTWSSEGNLACLRAFGAGPNRSRGVHRVYTIGFDGRELTLGHDTPGFAQRGSAKGSDDGSTLAGVWQLNEDEQGYCDDLAFTYRQASRGDG
jgi:hypothetical protein